jgi:hypothetical protein
MFDWQSYGALVPETRVMTLRLDPSSPTEFPVIDLYPRCSRSR